jgi:outer membrane immunogenic protein
MNRFLLTACAGLLAAAVASPSFAADVSRSAYQTPIFVAPFSWSGLYVGINGGYGWGTSNWTSTASTGSTKIKGGLVGGTVGFNMQTGAWVWGLEGDIDASWLKGSDNAGIGVCVAPGCETKDSWLGTARGRIGFAFDRWLPYFTGGVAFGDVKMSPNNALSGTKTQLGWTLGGGVEYAFMGPWSAKIEYLYVDLGKSICGAAICGIDTGVSFRTSIVRAGLNYRF